MATKKAALPSTQKYLNILAIRDGMVVLRDGGIRSILEVGSLNFALKSEEEQNGMIYQYQQFLNSLKFPLQIVMQSRRLDLFNYLKKLNELLEKQTNDLIRIQTEEYIAYIEKLLTRANIMDKKFYLVVPYFPSGVEKTGMIDKVLGAGSKTGEIHFTQEKFDEYKQKLDERVNVVVGGLGSLGLRARTLETQEIIEMLYGIYNPSEAISERMTEVSNLESPIVKSDIGVKSEAQNEETDKNTPAPPTDVSGGLAQGNSDGAGQAAIPPQVPPEAVTPPAQNMAPETAGSPIVTPDPAAQNIVQPTDLATQPVINTETNFAGGGQAVFAIPQAIQADTVIDQAATGAEMGGQGAAGPGLETVPSEGLPQLENIIQDGEMPAEVDNQTLSSVQVAPEQETQAAVDSVPQQNGTG